MPDHDPVVYELKLTLEGILANQEPTSHSTPEQREIHQRITSTIKNASPDRVAEFVNTAHTVAESSMGEMYVAIDAMSSSVYGYLVKMLSDHPATKRSNDRSTARS